LVDLPKNIANLLEGSFRRTPNNIIRQYLKMNRQTAERRLSDLRSRISSDAQGRTGQPTSIRPFSAAYWGTLPSGQPLPMSS
jgi:hypothetical protein